MKRKVNFFLAFLLFIALTFGAFAETNLTHLVNKTQPAIVTIYTYDQNKKPLKRGTGFFINTNTLITNYHVLRGAHKAELITHGGMKYPITQVIAENKEMDLIKLFVDIPRESRKSISHVNLTKSLPSIAEKIIVIGCLFRLEQTVSEGIISSVLLIPPLDTILQISAPIYAGSSGSPVLNMKGEVVGIVSFSISGGQNLNFAIPTEYILNLVPMETPKTISDWTEQKMFRLYIDTEPEGARVRILNIKPKFFQGIPLEPGQYHIEVLSDGYKTKNMWIRMEIGEDKILRVSLEKQPQLFSQNPDELLSISDTYVEKGEYEKAINILDQAIQINPNDAKTHFALGAAYLRSRDKSSALDQYKILKDLDKELANQLFNLIYE